MALGGPHATPTRARALLAAGILARLQGNPDQAAALGAESLAMSRRLGDDALAAEALFLLGFAELDLGRATAARSSLEEALTAFQTAGAKRWIAVTLTCLGEEAWVRGDHERVEAVLAEAVPPWRETGAEWGLAWAMFLLASAARARGAHERAVWLYHESLVLSAGHRRLAVDGIALIGLADVVTLLDRPAAAARLLGAADGQYRRLVGQPVGGYQVLYEEVAAKARAALGEAEFGAARAAGLALAVDEILAEARALMSDLPVPSSSGDRVAAQPAHGLTSRELEVLRLVATGRSNREIADALFISVPTVKRHLTTVLGELGLPSRSALTAYAHTHGLA